MREPKKIKTIATALGSCNYGDKPADVQLAFLTGYLAGAAAATAQTQRVNENKALLHWSMLRNKEAASLCKLLQAEQNILNKQTGIAHQN